MDQTKRIGWVAGLVLALIGCVGIFYLGNLMTVDPATTSGNGNPMLLALPILFLIGGMIVQGWMAVIMNWSLRSIWSVFAIIPVLLYVSYRYQANEFDRYRTYVITTVMNDEWRADWDYANSVTDIFSIYMNNQLYNVNTFFMYVGLTLWIGIVLMLLKRSTFMLPK